MNQLHLAGLRIPADVAVAGYGDITYAQISEPPLTTVHVPLAHMGTMAVQLLQQIMEHPDQHPDDILVNVELVVRASTQVTR